MAKLNKLLMLIMLIALNFTFALAQEEEPKSEQKIKSENPKREKKESEFKHFRAAFSIGHGYIPQANSNSVHFLILPTIGLDFQFWFTPKWGIGLKSDLEIANYTIEKEDNQGSKVVRENPLIMALPVLFSPWEKNGLLFLAGPAIEIEKNENFFVVRLGIGYEFEFGKEWDFSPEFIYDLKNGNINSFTFALGVGKRF